MTGTKWGQRLGRAYSVRFAVDLAHSGRIDRPSRQPRLGAVLAAVVVALTLHSRNATAQVTPIENFESYADSTALQTVWIATAPPSVTLDPAGITGKSMRVDYDVSAGPNSVVFDFGSDQDFTLSTTIRIRYKVLS